MKGSGATIISCPEEAKQALAFKADMQTLPETEEKEHHKSDVITVHKPSGTRDVCAVLVN